MKGVRLRLPPRLRPPRLRILGFAACLALTAVAMLATPAYAADIDPTGIGDLLPAPATGAPEGSGTLYETYGNPGLWQLDSDFSGGDTLAPTMQSIADISMALVVVLATACIVIVQWVLRLTEIPALEHALTSAIGAASGSLATTLLPSALAVGALVAFVQHRRGGGGGGLSQLTWVFVAGLVSVSLLSSPQTWISGVDTARSVGSTVTVNATGVGMPDTAEDFPFELGHKPEFEGDAKDDGLRRSSDAIWRAYVATPWCVAEFGSFEACREHGRGLLEAGTDPKERREWLRSQVDEDAVGADSAAWHEGGNPVGRIMVTLPALVSVALFATLVLALAFTSLASLIGALLLLLAGVLFACLWVIPGKPRQWGVRWFDQLLARTLESFLATLMLGAVLSVQIAATQLFGPYGWLPMAGLGIAAAAVGLRFRSALSQILSTRGTPMGAVGGLLATKALNRTALRLSPTGRGGGRDGAVRPSRTARLNEPVTVRVPRLRPPAPRPVPALTAAPSEQGGLGHRPAALLPGPSASRAGTRRPPVPVRRTGSCEPQPAPTGGERRVEA